VFGGCAREGACFFAQAGKPLTMRLFKAIGT